MSQASIFSVNVDDLEDCTCRMGTVFGGDYWDAPPTTSPEDCEAHGNDVLQRRPTRASLNFALDMERLRLARPDALPPITVPHTGTRTVAIGHEAIRARIDAEFGMVTHVEAKWVDPYPRSDHAVPPIPEGRGP